MNTFNREMVVIGDAMGTITRQFTGLIQLIVYLSVPLWLNFSLTLIVIGMVVLLAIPFLVLHKLSYRLGKANTDTANDLMGVLAESLTSARLVLGFARQTQTLNKYYKSFDRHANVAILSQAMTWMIHFMFLPVAIGAAMVGIGLSIEKQNNLAEIAAVLWSLLRAMPKISELLKNNIALSNFLPSYEQLKNLRAKAADAKEIQGEKEFKILDESISLREVDFSYPSISGTLQKVCLEVKKNQMTALVGPSGSGKSTISDLLLGLQEPDKGEVLLNGLPLNEWHQNSFREKVGYIPQDPQLFNCSIRENLLWSFEKASEKELWEVCRLSNAEEFIKKLPQGLDTVVGDRGVRLSGGQRQRIALARALIRKPEFLILAPRKVGRSSSFDQAMSQLAKKDLHQKLEIRKLDIHQK